MKKKLYPYQKTGAAFLAEHPHALLADEPGLGKTLQAIAAVEILGLKNILVVCPASVRLNWLQEVNECLGSSYGWTVISYNGATSPAILARLAEKYDALILDEGHFLKTPESQRTQAIFGKSGLARRAKYIWALSGTPVLNRPRELFPVLKTLHPGFADISHNAFVHKYCAAFWDGFGLNTKGASNLPELAKKLEGFMLRRTKKEVLPELPEKIYSRVPLEVTEADMREVWAEEALISNREAKISSVAEDFSQLGDMARLLRITGEAKVRAASEWIVDLLTTTPKVVVFARHRDVIRRLEAALTAKHKGVVVYHGGMSDGQKQDAIKKFQQPGTSVFVGQIQAAGTGINGLQTVCSHVVFAELSWVPGEVGQATDRLHRIGQSAGSVSVYMLHIPGSLESAVLAAHDSKVKVIERLMNDDILKDLI